MKDRFTRFTVENGDRKIVWETPHEDIDGEDCMDAIFTLMTGLTFLPYTVIKSMSEYVKDHSHLLNNE